ncbi:conserved hypothetical protein [metagenome]|uniref:Uncharacterized protein n=1 Tax=metagenome TaxID=256318 RepID=A0A2P2C4H7_9ZZZZ
MTESSAGLRTALTGLDQALDLPRQRGSRTLWRESVRRHIESLRDQLDRPAAADTEDWAAARSGAILRERNALLNRMAALGPQVQATDEVDQLREEIKRLLNDVNHHLQRLSDLAYDAVELELGGSE